MSETSWSKLLRANPLPWLLAPDAENPGVRYFTLVDLLDVPPDSKEAQQARAALMTSGPVPAILDAQSAEGYWITPGAGYLPKYQSTVWSVTFLAQLGADGNDERVKKGCQTVLENNICALGGLSYNGTNAGMIHCLQGILAAALIDLGWLGDERLARALDWLARSITGEGIAPAEEKDVPARYYRSANNAPGFACGANNHLPCAWGAVKAGLALGKVPVHSRTGEIKQAIAAAAEFLLSGNPVEANYPQWAAEKPNRSWFQFGYPLGYVTDVLQNLEVLVSLGYAADPRVAAGAEYALRKQDTLGRWKMEYTYNGKTWVDVEEKGKPSKWVTLRSLRLVKHVSAAN